MPRKSINKQQFGDFQTPTELAEQVVEVLKRNHKIKHEIVIEPTCGKGAFVHAANKGFEYSQILGFDINKKYVDIANSSLNHTNSSNQISIQESDFFDTNWEEILSDLSGYILIIGNPPWVTSSDLGAINSKNIPEKSNFQNHKGIDAITGSGNFDISEWMILQHINWLSKRDGAIAFLCKYAVARKVLKHVRKNSQNRFFGHIYPINAKVHFNASVEACLFVLTTDVGNTDCEIFESLESTLPCRTIGERDGVIVSNVETYGKWKHLKGQDSCYIWRSGIKHDCSKVMELEPYEGKFKNGLNEVLSLESSYIFPLLKSSDVGNGRVNSYRKMVLVTQKFVGDETLSIKQTAPKTWEYLSNHREYLSKRKSSIYKNKPEFSVFGIGAYTFKPWKIAISGFYKKLKFNLIGLLDDKVVAFDDTVNFLSFDTEEEATFIFNLITSKPSIDFLESMIFWDDKRPITIDILRRLSLKEVSKELGEFEQYIKWVEAKSYKKSSGQLELALAENSADYKVLETC